MDRTQQVVKRFLQDAGCFYVMCLMMTTSLAAASIYALLHAVFELTLQVLFGTEWMSGVVMTSCWIAGMMLSVYATIWLIFIDEDDDEVEGVAVLTWRYDDCLSGK